MLMGNPALDLFPFLKVHEEGRKHMAIFHTLTKNVVNKVQPPFFLEKYRNYERRKALHTQRYAVPWGMLCISSSLMGGYLLAVFCLCPSCD
jgi:hypothetical protein